MLGKTSFALVLLTFAAAAAASGPDPSDPIFQQHAPAKYTVDFDTTAGAFSIEVERESAPIGADRFFGLVKEGFYNGNSFFRVVPGFVVQWGINGNPDIQSRWREARITGLCIALRKRVTRLPSPCIPPPAPKPHHAIALLMIWVLSQHFRRAHPCTTDDPNKRTNAPGTITFATSGPNSRTTQLFINLKANAFLDRQGFAPFGKIVGDGLRVVEAINSEAGQRPDQGRIQQEGDACKFIFLCHYAML